VNARIRAVLLTATVTAAFVAPVSLLHLLTKGRVELNQEIRLKRAVLEAAGLEAPASNSDAAALFDSRVERSGAEGGETYLVGPAGGADQAAGEAERAFVKTQTGAGLWGRIVALVGFEADGVTMTGLSFLEQTETPGLGARIDESWFKAQFRGKRGPLATVPEGAAAGTGQFDAVSGATITSNAVRDIVNAAAGEMRSRARK
jgi:Na+-transporting NADH:ubiquinone oxidoreductase subunit C